MPDEIAIRKFFLVIALIGLSVLSLIVFSPNDSGVLAGLGLLVSPVSTPFSQFNSPLPTPVPSGAAQKAITYISIREKIPAEALKIDADHSTTYPNLGQKFQVVTLIDTRPQGQVYKLLVDLTNGHIEEDFSVLMDAEVQAHQAHYGKMELTLYERLQTKLDNDLISIVVFCRIANESSCWSKPLLLSKQLGKNILGLLAVLKLVMRVQDERLDQGLRLLPTGFPNGFEG